MDALHAQKENVDANAGVTTKLRFSGSDNFATPKRGFVIHSDSKSGNKGLKESTAKKRRVLGDISNKHRNRQTDANPNEIVSAKKSGLGKGDIRSKTPRSKKAINTHVKATPVPKSVRVEETPDIEVAYGGLPSPQSDAASLLRLRDEMEKELVNDKTPTLFDDFDPARAYGDWDDELEKKLLESGAPPSPWWSPSPPHSEKGVDKADAKEEVDLGDEAIPLPDDLPDDALDDLDDNDLLDELVSVDVDAAFKEK